MAKEKSEFIKVAKDDEVIEVHPLALADHKRLGWKVVEAEDLVPIEPEAQPADKKQLARAARASQKKNKAAEKPAE